MTDASIMTSASEENMAASDEAASEALYAATKRKLFSTVLPIVKQRHLAEGPLTQIK